MEHRRPSWSMSINSDDSDLHHLRFFINTRTKREDETQVVWRLSLNNHETQTYEYVWLQEAEVMAIARIESEGDRFIKADYYLRYCGKTIRHGALNKRT